MIDEILEELRLDCRLCKIDRGYKSGVDFGIVVGFNDDVVCIKQYDRDGIYDGLKIFTKSDIESLVFNGNELNSMTKFIQNRGANLDAVDVDYSGFDEFIDTACRKFGYARLNDDSGNCCFIGKVINHDEDNIHILTWGNPSQRDRFDVILAKWKVDSIAVDDLYSRNLMSIHSGKIRA